MSDEQTPLDQELNRELRSREYDRLYSILEKTEEATIKSAENAIRILLLINGGAAVAVLAFVGNLASKGSVQTDQLNAMAGSLVWFALGVAGAVVCAFFFYLTNFSYLFATQAQERHVNPPYVSQTRKAKRLRCVGRIFHGLALVVALGSFSLFVYGIFDIRNAITHSPEPRACRQHSLVRFESDHSLAPICFLFPAGSQTCQRRDAHGGAAPEPRAAQRAWRGAAL